MTRTHPAPQNSHSQTDIEKKLEQLGELVKRILISMRFPDSSSELTPTQFIVLTSLEQRPLRIGVLASIIGAAQNTTSEVVARLQRSDLVSKKTDPADQRAVLVALTDRGAQTLKLRRTAIRSVHQSILEALSPKDRQRFVEAFELLVEMTERARESTSKLRQKTTRSK